MRGKTARQALRTDRRAECFNEAPLLCGERPSALGCLFRLLRASMRPRFYAGKDRALPARAVGLPRASMRPRFYAGKDSFDFSLVTDIEDGFNEAPLLCGERPVQAVDQQLIDLSLQ